MRIVVALGGNALLRARRADDRRRASARTSAIAAARWRRSPCEHELVISHGNGPQVGLLALQAAAYDEVEAYPLDVLGAQTEGMIGYLIEQELGNLLPFEKPFATMLTMIEVDPDGPGVRGPHQVRRARLRRGAGATPLAAEKGWMFKPDGDALAPRGAVARSPAHLRDPARSAGCSSRARRHLRRRRRHPDHVRPEGDAHPGRRRGGHRQGPAPASCWRASSTPTCS